MLVTKDTKISEILKENPDAVEVIAGINKHFRKLKNPLLRKVLAPRVSVKDAAKIGNTEVNNFLEKLQAIGFEVKFDTADSQKDNKVTGQPLDSLSTALELTAQGAQKIVEFDVRPTIESGADPFKEIMQAIKGLNEDETLKVINVFEPIPLITILKEKGYKSWTEEISNTEYHTFFSKQSESSHQEIVADMPITEGSFEEKLVSFGSNLKEIDVRHLEMPEPMVTILKEIETLPEGHLLFVNHKKVPQFLLPELKSRGFTWMHKDIEPGLTHLLIFRQ